MRKRLMQSAMRGSVSQSILGQLFEVHTQTICGSKSRISRERRVRQIGEILCGLAHSRSMSSFVAAATGEKEAAEK